MSGRPATRVEEPGASSRLTILDIILRSASYLKEKGVPSPRLDAEHLLAHALGVGRLDLYLQFDRPLDEPELEAFRPLLRRRGRREPLQYVIGSTPFRELTLRTDRRALIPRPETEYLVERILARIAARGDDPTALAALDVGTGTGAIALSLAGEGGLGRVVATDASVEALELARANAALAGLADRVDFRHGEGYGPLEPGERFDWVVSNPPYVARAELERTEPEVREWEPTLALAAGPEGLDVLDGLIAGAGDHLRTGGMLALEIGAGQGPKVLELIRATEDFREPELEKDLAGRVRYAFAERA